MAGDIVDTEVNYYYPAGYTDNGAVASGTFLTNLLSIMNGAAPVASESQAVSSAVNGNVNQIFAGANGSSANPRAYLNYILFDRDFNYEDSGYVQVGSQNSNPQPISQQINIQKTGYIYVYVSNESNTNFDVFFDDLRITHTKGKILQEDHYYPFGLSINALSSSAPLSKPNHYKFNGNEEQTDFDLNLYDFNARMYDPILGRFNSVDPLAEKQYRHNPYHYSYNNPILFNDPTGLFGDYFYEAGGEIYYLGDDGETDEKQYLVTDLSKFSNARDANGGLNSGTTASLLESGGAKEITISLPGGQSEGELFNALYEKGMAESGEKTKEQGVSLILNTETATLTATVNSDASSTSTYSIGKTPEEISKDNPNNIMVGRAHTHQIADFIMSEMVGDRPLVSTAAFHEGDRTKTAFLGVPQYSFDSRFIQKQVPTTSMGQPATNSIHGPATSSLYNGRFSILRDALKTVSIDQSK